MAAKLYLYVRSPNLFDKNKSPLWEVSKQKGLMLNNIIVYILGFSSVCMVFLRRSSCSLKNFILS